MWVSFILHLLYLGTFLYFYFGTDWYAFGKLYLPE